MSSANGSNGNNGSGNSGSPCGACKFLRRKCLPSCIFAPYFDSEQGTNHFAAVHKVFGASNVSKLLVGIPVHRRLDTVITICYEAQARLRDPVYGCVAHIFALQQQVVNLQAELSYVHGHIAQMELPQPPPLAPLQTTAAMPGFSIADLPSATFAAAVPGSTYDLSSLFDPLGQASWAMQQRGAIDPRQYMTAAAPAPSTGATSADHIIQAGARDFPHSHGSPPSPPASSSNASPSPSFS